MNDILECETKFPIQRNTKSNQAHIGAIESAACMATAET